MAIDDDLKKSAGQLKALTKPGTQGLAAMNASFITALGCFSMAWLHAGALVDFAIGKFLKLPHDETHLVTAAMEFGRKAVLLRTLIARSNHKHKEKLLTHLNTIQNSSKRNVFSHSYLRSTPQEVTFIERTTHGKYTATPHTFTVKNFVKHSLELAATASEFAKLIGTEAEIEDFIKAASSVKTSA